MRRKSSKWSHFCLELASPSRGLCWADIPEGKAKFRAKFLLKIRNDEIFFVCATPGKGFLGVYNPDPQIILDLIVQNEAPALHQTSPPPAAAPGEFCKAPKFAFNYKLIIFLCAHSLYRALHQVIPSENTKMSRTQRVRAAPGLLLGLFHIPHFGQSWECSGIFSVSLFSLPWQRT